MSKKKKKGATIYCPENLSAMLPVALLAADLKMAMSYLDDMMVVLERDDADLANQLLKNFQSIAIPRLLKSLKIWKSVK